MRPYLKTQVTNQPKTKLEMTPGSILLNREWRNASGDKPAGPVLQPTVVSRHGESEKWSLSLCDLFPFALSLNGSHLFLQAPPTTLPPALRSLLQWLSNCRNHLVVCSQGHCGYPGRPKAKMGDFLGCCHWCSLLLVFTTSTILPDTNMCSTPAILPTQASAGWQRHFRISRHQCREPVFSGSVHGIFASYS